MTGAPLSSLSEAAVFCSVECLKRAVWRVRRSQPAASVASPHTTPRYGDTMRCGARRSVPRCPRLVPPLRAALPHRTHAPHSRVARAREHSRKSRRRPG
eukprot:6213172-Pleurochrysis_carterae.AAC.3